MHMQHIKDLYAIYPKQYGQPVPPSGRRVALQVWFSGGLKKCLGNYLRWKMIWYLRLWFKPNPNPGQILVLNAWVNKVY